MSIRKFWRGKRKANQRDRVDRHMRSMEAEQGRQLARMDAGLAAYPAAKLRGAWRNRSDLVTGGGNGAGSFLGVTRFFLHKKKWVTKKNCQHIGGDSFDFKIEDSQGE